MTTFFPLTLSGEGFFYYMYFPAKKGRVSLRRGETTVRSVIEVFYPLQRKVRRLFRPQRDDNITSLSIDRPKGVHGEDKS